jgi:hypothetical protein
VGTFITDKALLGTVATMLTLVSFLPYLRSIHSGHTCPHVFSWVIWGITTGIAFLAVLAEGGGAGAWPIAVSCAITLCVAAVAYRRRTQVHITGADRLCFLAALSALPLWLLAGDAPWAIVVITAIELLGFGPTVRKSWRQPWSESLSFYVLVVARNAFTLAALERYLTSTVLFPAVMTAACVLTVVVLLYRRRVMPSTRVHFFRSCQGGLPRW